MSQAYFYQGNYEKELFYRKRILDQNDYLPLYNYAFALFRNQAHISILLENDYVKAYDFCDKALEVYYK